MKANTLRKHIDLHGWLGMLAGLALFVAFFAGALNMFHEELHHWQEPYVAESDGGEGDLQALLDQVLAVTPEAAKLMYLVPGDDPVALWQDADQEWQFDHASDFNAAGERVKKPRSELAEFINELHYKLALPVVGLYLMGIISVLYGAALIGGLVIHWPKLKKEFFALRHQGNLRRYWKNLHNLVGVISFPFHAIFAITGAAMGCFALLALVAGTLVFGPQLQGAITDATEAWPTPRASGESVAMAGVEAYVAAARAELPDLRVDWIELQQYGDRNAVVDVAGSVPGWIAHHAHVVLAGDDARTLTVTSPGNRPFNHAALSPVYSLHFGDYGGLLVRSLYFVLGLLGCLLFFSGNVMWAERRTDRQGPSRSAIIMLRVTLGVTFGVMAGLAVSCLANKVVSHSPWAGAVAWSEKGAFLAVLLLTLLLALRAAPLAMCRWGLRGCIALYLLVPLVQGGLEGFASWREPHIHLVNTALWAVAASLAAVEWLRVRRLRRAGPHPLWVPAPPAPASEAELASS